MTNTIITAGLFLWGIAALFAMAFIRGATGRAKPEIQRRECEQ
jgi:hypothetical protein